MRKLAFGLALLIVVPLAHGQTGEPKNLLVKRFFQLRERMLDQRGSEKDVEELLGMFKADARYEHPAAGVSLDLAQVRSGMKAHLNEGRDARIEVTRVWTGNNFVVAETTLRYTLRDNNVAKPIVRPGVAIFQFEGLQITRVAEY